MWFSMLACFYSTKRSKIRTIIALRPLIGVAFHFRSRRSWISADCRHVLVEDGARLQAKQHRVVATVRFVEFLVNHNVTDRVTIFHRVVRIDPLISNHDHHLICKVFVASAIDPAINAHSHTAKRRSHCTILHNDLLLIAFFLHVTTGNDIRPRRRCSMSLTASTLRLTARKSHCFIGLDLSAAFDTLCHSTLTKRLRTEYGVCGTALSWIQSYYRTGHSLWSLGSIGLLEPPWKSEYPRDRYSVDCCSPCITVQSLTSSRPMASDAINTPMTLSST